MAFHFNAVPLVVVNVSPNCRDALAPVGFAVPSLTLAIVAALIVVLLAAWDSVAYRRHVSSQKEAAT